jgi:thiamine-phosphate pyrophosphorylase
MRLSAEASAASTGGGASRPVFPRTPLYAIVDSTCAGPGGAEATAGALLRGGVRLLQYRHKGPFTRQCWDQCRAIAEAAAAAGAIFIVNDRADIAVLAGAAGVHLGQDDLPPQAARRLVGQRLIGFSTHSPAQARDAVALGNAVDYIAIGPVFPTRTKENPGPAVGVETVAAVRRITSKPLVAIGGITLESAASVIAAGADAVAVIHDLTGAGDVESRARQYLEKLNAGGGLNGL